MMCREAVRYVRSAAPLGSRRRARPLSGWPVALALGALLAVCGCGPAEAVGAARFEAERLDVPRSAGRIVADQTAGGGQAISLTGTARASGRITAATEARLEVRARADRCARPPALAVEVDGMRVLTASVRSGSWRTYRARPSLRPGARALALRLATRPRATCRGGAVRVDRIVLSGRRTPAQPIWRPPPDTTWQWQLTTPVDQEVDAELFNIDAVETPARVVAALRARGRRVICYMSAGSVERWRPDASDFPAAVRGRTLEGWPDERWLDVRRLDLLAPIIERRLDGCRAKRFDGVEFDNVDAYANASGFPLRARHQLEFNRYLARAAHARGLSAGLKNDLDQVEALEPDFDWALVEECFEHDECERTRAFLRAGKAVFVAEYALPASRFCAQARTLGVMAMRKRIALDAWREPCW
jgi:hypothetical protein